MIEASRSCFKPEQPKFRPPFLKLLATALLLATSAAFTSSQVLNPKTSQTPRRLPLTKFYDTPDPLPSGRPGELIRSEPFYEYLLPYTISAVRILYHSRSPHDKDVAASGVVLLPRGTAPPGGWPIIAWAHDLTGSARQCPPSLLKTLNEGPLLSMYVGLGYAVVASDYAGLGTNFPYAVLDVPSNAQDVINSVAAARAALPQLGSKWLVAGYERGSRVALAWPKLYQRTLPKSFWELLEFWASPTPRNFSSTLHRRGHIRCRFSWHRELKISMPNSESKTC